ncbi:hypothetical protein BpHYR1_049875 [Brachionus plicatilis]|uniref:Uncharacterized protein n=1 Tax=Brachionus plicatilis TaxID=10195 RepID=A0A3M7PT89_BRAPC|nr:hypothetical protein BpHYR1_049875 [Brachionus plicatilis]
MTFYSGDEIIINEKASSIQADKRGSACFLFQYLFYRRLLSGIENIIFNKKKSIRTTKILNTGLKGRSITILNCPDEKRYLFTVICFVKTQY